MSPTKFSDFIFTLTQERRFVIGAHIGRENKLPDGILHDLVLLTLTVTLPGIRRDENPSALSDLGQKVLICTSAICGYVLAIEAMPYPQTF